MRTNSEITTDIALERAAVPQKAESEKLVLGSIMAGYVDFGTIAAIISVDDFSVESRRTIWRVIEQRDLRGESLDRSVVAENLHSIGKLEAAGGLSALLDMEPLNLPKHVEAAARSMRDAAVLRRLYLELDQLALAISEGSTNSTEALGRAEVFVSELAGRLIDSKGLTTVEAAITASGMSPADWLSDCSARAVLENPIVGMRELLDGFRGGELVIIAARPGNGKTALAGQLAETGCSAGVGCAFYSLEMSTSQIISRLVCGRANINSRRLRSGELGRTERQRIAAEAGDQLLVDSPAGGMQLLARLNGSVDDAALARRLEQSGVTARPLSEMHYHKSKERGLFLGFAAWNDAEIDAGAQIIGRCIRRPRQSAGF